MRTNRARVQGLLLLAALLGGGIVAPMLDAVHNLPTGPVVVCVFGLLLLAAFGLKRLIGVPAPA